MGSAVIAPRALDQLKRIMRRLHAWGVRTLGGSEGADFYIGELLDEFDMRLAEVEQNPEAFPYVDDPALARLGYRRFLVRKQFVVVYRVEDGVPKVRCVFDPRTEYRTLMRDTLVE